MWQNNPSTKEIISHVLTSEAEALHKISTTVAEDLSAMVHSLSECTGRIFTVGVGKSHFVALKIAASLNSIGRSAIAMHAGDALHGDLGGAKTEDVFLIFSKSGESQEVVNLIEELSFRGNTILSICHHRESTLFQKSEVTVTLPLLNEADPFNILPSVSTIQQMAAGDALVVALMAKDEVNETQFSKNHPSGALGKKLTVLIKDFISNKPIPKVAFNASIKEVIISISESRLGATAVLNTENKVVGIITDGDLRRMLQSHSSMDALNASDILTPHPKHLPGTASIHKALDMMRIHKITQIIILDDGVYQGIIHMHDVLENGFM